MPQAFAAGVEPGTAAKPSLREMLVSTGKVAMFEVVYETRREGSTPDDGSPPQTSLVLETKFTTEAEADEAMQGFQRPFPDKWDEAGKSMRFARDPEEPKWHIWYWRPVS